MSSKTPEQKAADDALEAALDQVMTAYDIEGVRAGYVLGLDVVLIDEHGDQCSSFAWHQPAGQRWTATLGLTEVMRLRIHQEYLTPPD